VRGLQGLEYLDRVRAIFLAAAWQLVTQSCGPTPLFCRCVLCCDPDLASLAGNSRQVPCGNWPCCSLP
jgi:hypothetical protein